MLSVIITHFRSPVTLKLCLRSLRETLQGIPHEIIVSDSEAQRETGRIVRHDFPEVIYLAHETNVGYARLVNAGIKKAKGDTFLIINADTVLPEGSAEGLLKYLKEHPDVGIVGPRLEYQNGKHQPSAFRFYTPLTIIARRTVLKKLRFGREALDRFMLKDVLREPVSEMEPLSVSWMMGSALMVRKKAVEEVGVMDTRYFLYMEDVDWCRRFWDKGWKVVWLPSVRIVHVHAQASKKRGGVLDVFFNKLTRIHIRSAIKYFRKWGLKTPDYGV